jgi:hypothetical protein
MIMFGSSLPSALGWLVTTKVYSGTGADIVMESISLIDLQKGETKAHACETAWFQQYNRAGVTCRKKSLSLAS